MSDVKRYALNFCDRLEECKEGYLVYYDDYKALEEKYLALLAETRWISVDEALPECDDTVLVYYGDPSISPEFDYTDYNVDDGSVYWVNSGDLVTHWMPLPKNPE
jgi:hypothetical protein